MCRMLLAVGDVDLNELIDAFMPMAKDQNIVHELNSEHGMGSWDHADGWGIAYLTSKNTWKIEKSTTPIFKDPKINELRTKKAKVALIHARKKMGSEKAIQNTHPFFVQSPLRGKLVFCHNGFIEEEIHFDPKYTPQSETDSERLFYSILTDLKRRNFVKAIRKNFKRYTKLTGTNIILTHKDQSVIAIRKNHFPKYYQMHMGKRDNLLVVSSEAISIKDINWRPLQQGDIVKIKNSNAHTKIYKQSDRFLRQARAPAFSAAIIKNGS